MKKSSDRKCFFLLFLLFPFYAQSLLAQTIKAGDSFSKTIQLKDKHQYQLSLTKGQFSVLTIHQKGIDLSIKTYAPNGELIEIFDSPNGNNGPELVLLDAVEKGVYRIEITPLGASKKVTTGSYELTDMVISNNPTTHLEAVISILNNRKAIPGFALSIVHSSGVLYKNGFGFANLATKTPYTTETIHNIGSTSKTMIGLALMVLIEEGKLTLDTPINTILPFQVVNPYFPNIPITVRHLVNHTATIKDTKHYEKSYILNQSANWIAADFQKSDAKTLATYQKNKDMPLPNFLKNLLDKKGKWYKKKNFHKIKPGTVHHYSNAGATLAAYLVELIAEESFADFTRKKIIEPLSMKNTHWLMEKVDATKFAKRYGVKNIPLPDYQLITYPDGGLITNVDDLSTYLIELIKGNNGLGTILSPNSFTAMLQNNRVTNNKRAYGVFVEVGLTGRIGHSGADPGIVSMLFFDPKTNLGTIMMANRLPKSIHARLEFLSIWKSLGRYAPYFKNPSTALSTLE